MTLLKNLDKFTENLIRVLFLRDQHALQLASLPYTPSTNLNQSSNDGLVFFRRSEVDLGVPKYRTCKPRIMTRKFGFPKLMSVNPTLVECHTCGTTHSMHNICGTCYNVVKAETDKIKTEKLGLRKME